MMNTENHGERDDTSPEADVHLQRSLIEQSIHAFERDLNDLLRDHYFKWAAYHGNKRIGIGLTETELYIRAQKMGLDENEFVVKSIQPHQKSEEIEILY